MGKNIKVKLLFGIGTENRKQIVLYDFFLFVIILNFSSIYASIAKTFLLFLFFIVGLYILFTNIKLVSFKINEFYNLLFFLAFYVVITLFIYPQGIVNYLIFIIKILTIFFVCRIIEKKGFNIIELFLELMYFILCFHFILYILLLLGIPFKKVYFPNIQITIYSYLFTASPFDLFVGLKRFSALFTEPGITQIVVNLCLFYYLFIKYDKWKLFILSAMLISTMSVTGYFVYILILFSHFMFYQKKTILWTILFFVFTMLFIFFLFIYISMFSEKMETVSFLLRQQDIKIAIELILERPILGWGYVNEDIVKSRMVTSLSKMNLGDFSSFNRGLSNGLLTIFVNMGIIFFIWYLRKLFVTCKTTLSRGSFVLFLILLIGLLGEPLEYSLLYMIFLVGGKKKCARI